MSKNVIFVVEDEESIRELYTCALEGAGFETHCFVCGDDMLAALNEKTPNLFILDVMLDGMSGFDILSLLKNNAACKDVPVIMVSAKGDEMSKVKGLNLGADDYIGKPFGVMELIARINANIRRNNTVESFEYKGVRIDEKTHTVSINGEEVACSLKLYGLLKFLVRHAATVVKRDDLLNAVWGADYFGETRTVDMHVAEARKRLAEYGAEATIETLRGVGYILK